MENAVDAVRRWFKLHKVDQVRWACEEKDEIRVAVCDTPSTFHVALLVAGFLTQIAGFDQRREEVAEAFRHVATQGYQEEKA